MEMRKLGQTGVDLTVIGFGTWVVGGGGWEFGWGSQDDAESMAAIRRALDLGINWIDTAPAYGLGHSERIVGQAIAGRRDEVFLATKCGLSWDDAGNVHRDLRPATIRQEVEDSLRRLNVEVIDLMQIHWPDPNVPLEESWGTLADLVQQGKLRFIGVSNYSPAQIDAIKDIHPVASVQPPYSLLKRDIEADLLPYCAEHQIGVVPYSPLQSGLLTGKFDPTALAADDWRRRDFTDADFAQAKALTDRLTPLAARSGHTMAQLAIAWANAQPGVTSSIVGARRPSQIEETVVAGGWTLSDAELAEVAEALAAVGA